MAFVSTAAKASGGGGSGTVTNVASANSAIAVANGTTTPTLTLATLDVIATDGPPAVNWSNNSKKITSLANGAAAQDAAAFGQIPTALPPSGAAGGDLSGTYPNPAVKAITETSGPTDLVVGAITDGQVLKRVGSTLVSVAAGAGTVTSVASGDTSLVVTNPNTTPSLLLATLDVIATNRPPVANWSNNSHKITGLANGTAASDAAAFGQIPTVAVKASDQTQTANTTLTNDADLLFGIGASATEVWYVEAFLYIVGGNATMDFKCGWTGPTAATMQWGMGFVAGATSPSGLTAIAVAGSPPANSAIGGSNAIGTISGSLMAGVQGFVFGGGTAGNIQFQWAQNTSDPGNLVVKLGSFLRATKVRL